MVCDGDHHLSSAVDVCWFGCLLNKIFRVLAHSYLPSHQTELLRPLQPILLLPQAGLVSVASNCFFVPRQFSLPSFELIPQLVAKKILGSAGRSLDLTPSLNYADQTRCDAEEIDSVMQVSCGFELELAGPRMHL